MTLRVFSNPVMLAAVIIAVLVYSGLVKVADGESLHTLADINEVCVLSGKIASNPVRISKGTSYMMKLRPIKVADEAGREYSCTGEVDIVVPSNIVEAYHSASLFTSSYGKGVSSGASGNVLCESGENIVAYGKISYGGAFNVKRIESAYWESTMFGRVARFRAACRIRFRALLSYWGAAGGLLLALISGMREYTSYELFIAFRDAGLPHILALSGMHLSLMSGVALTISTRAIGRRAAYAVQVAAVSAFVWFTGFSPGLLRATLCAYIMLATAACGLGEQDMLDIVCAAFVIQVIVAPTDAITAAFMLSYASITGILTVGDAAQRRLARYVPPVLSAPFGASFGAQAATAPISLYLFGTFAPCGLVASVVITPFILLFIYLGIASIVLSLIIPPLASPCGVLLGVLYEAVRWLVMLFAQFPLLNIK